MDRMMPIRSCIRQSIEEEVRMTASLFSPLYDLVTGGTRGAGRETVLALVRAGRPGVMFLYRQKEGRAQELVKEAREINPDIDIVAIKCDITDSSQITQIVAELNARKAYLSSLFLVASGGLERGMSEDYPMLMNKDAQLAVVNACWKLFAFGATVIYDTSHWAHRFGEVEQLPDYEPIASSKNAGERSLLKLIPTLERLDQRNVKFVIVTGDMLVDSMVVRLMERKSPGIISARLKAAGVEELPTYLTFGQKNVDVLLDQDIRNGDVIVVGGALETLTPLQA